MSERAREAAARALVDKLKSPGMFDELDEDVRNGWLIYANAAIDAYIAALGETHAIVPREPTEAMLRAKSPEGGSLFGGVEALGGGMYPDESVLRQSQAIYRAMLNAAG